MAGVPAGRLSIEIVAEIARLQQDLDKAKRAVAAASGDIARNARAANDSLSNIGRGAGAGLREFTGEIARLKAQMDPAWAALQKYKQEVFLLSQAYRQGAVSQEQYTAGIMRSREAWQNASAGVVTATNAQRAGVQQLGMQIGDMATMYALGARPAQIFASQIGQITQAVQLMTGGTSKFAAFLSGPWGIALTTATILLSTLVTTTGEEEEAIKDLDQAFDFAAMSANQLAQVNGLLADSNREVTETAIQAAQAMGRQAQANATNASAELRRAEAELARQMAVTRNGGGIWTAGAAGSMANRSDTLRTTIAGLRREVRDAAADVAIMTAGLSEQEAAVEALTARQNDLRNAYVRTGDASLLQQAVAMQEQIDEASKATDRATRSTRRRREALTDEERALQQATREAANYIESLEDEYAQLTMSAEQLRARELQQRLSAAATDEQRNAIAQLSTAIEELMRIEAERAEANARQAKVEQYAQQELDKIKQAAQERQQAEQEWFEQRFGEMDKWLGQLNLTAEQMEMAFEEIQRNGVDALTNGLVDVMTGFRSLGDVARSVLSQILSDMLRLQIQQNIMGPLSQALGMMGSAGGPSAGLLGSVTQAFAANPGLFAKGTLSAPAGLAIVGEQGPELVNLRGGERIYPAGQTQQMLGTSNTINVNVSGAMNPQQARETGDQIGRRIRQQMNGRAA